MEQKQACKKKETAKIISQARIAPGIYDMWMGTGLAAQAAPGQFIAVYPKDKSTLLPRPISICEADPERGALRIVYRVAGKGTEEFSNYQAGDSIEIMGTLGNGFPTEKAAGKTALLMGGGIGVPPLVELAKELKEKGIAKQILITAGYRDGNLFLSEDLSQYGDFYPATEDGSAGTKGNVLDAVAAAGLKPDVIFACGPMPMLRAIKGYASESGIEAYISLEERMACGVGACLGCVCKTVKKDSHSHVNNARICTDGPVFEAKEVEI